MKEHIDSKDLIDLLNAGHNKLVPLLNDGKTPRLLIEEDIVRIEKENNRLASSGNHERSWFGFMENHPKFWTKEKLADPFYQQKFNNVAKITGYSGDYNYDLTLDIDSDYVYELLKSPKIMKNKRVKSFIKLNSFASERNELDSLFEFLSKITYTVKTRKKYGYHIHWKEDLSCKQILSSSCIERREFEIITEKHLVTLPPSRHRDDENFQYQCIEPTEVRQLDGLYKLLIEILSECLRNLGDDIHEHLPVTPPNDNPLSEIVNIENSKNLNEGQTIRLSKIIAPLYNKGCRNSIVLGITGLLYKSGFSKQSAISIIQRIVSDNNDEESTQRVSTVLLTYEKAEREGPDSITGISILRQIILSQQYTQKEEKPDASFWLPP